MHLGSRPAAATVGRLSRPEPSLPGLGLPDYSAGWPLHHGQSNKLRRHHYAAVSRPVIRGDDMCRFDNATPFLLKTGSLTEFQSWPKSEFELVTEEGEDCLKMFGEMDNSSFGLCPSEWSFSEDSVFRDSSVLSKKGSMEDVDMVERTKSDGISHGENTEEVKKVCAVDGRDFLETELVFNQHADEISVAFPMETATSVRRSKRQTRSMAVCRNSPRRRVHPIGRFANELVNWIPENGTTDDERVEDDDKNDVDFKHCIKPKTPKCNGSHIQHVNVKHNHKRTNTVKHHSKRKRPHFSTTRGDGGLHRRRKQHNPWSIEETRMLIKGVSICGEGHWADIKRLEFRELMNRSPVDLKDKWRNLRRLAQFPHSHSRNKKGEKRTDLPLDMLQEVRMLGAYHK